jgi:hypothetical protein
MINWKYQIIVFTNHYSILILCHLSTVIDIHCVCSLSQYSICQTHFNHWIGCINIALRYWHFKSIESKLLMKFHNWSIAFPFELNHYWDVRIFFQRKQHSIELRRCQTLRRFPIQYILIESKELAFLTHKELSSLLRVTFASIYSEGKHLLNFTST